MEMLSNVRMPYMHVIILVLLISGLDLTKCDENQRIEVEEGKKGPHDEEVSENEERTSFNPNSNTGKTPPPTSTDHQNVNDLKMYLKLFKQQRKIHQQALTALLGIDTYEKQYKMLSMGIEKLFKVLGSSKATLQEVGFSPGDPLPTNETVRDAFSNVVENTAFFGDLALRLPDITHKIYDGNKEWVLLMGWAVSFSNSSSIFASTDNELLNLMAQELNFIDRDPSYVNPYTAEYEKMVAKQMAKEGKSKKKKRTIKKGPRMSSVRNEL